MTYRELVKEGKAVTEDAEVLFRELFDWDLSRYLLDLSKEAEEEEILLYREALQKRKAHVPLQHITGHAPFFGRDFKVSDKVLIPRFDTEILVEEVIESLRQRPAGTALDLCTGSGIIALTLALETDLIYITASDISEEALKVAEENQKSLKADKVRFILSDMFENISERFDLIVSNPPYIRSTDIETLSPEVRDHDPRKALDGGEDGLYFYRIIAEQGKNHLKPDGRMFLEIGYDQGEDVYRILSENGYKDIRIIKDLSQKDRVITCLTD